MALQDHLFDDGFEYQYRGMRFAISSAGTDLYSVGTAKPLQNGSFDLFV